MYLAGVTLLDDKYLFLHAFKELIGVIEDIGLGSIFSKQYKPIEIPGLRLILVACQLK